ncbi:hypothetical protein ACL02O_02220 [Micromonospora sp. MS34]|uniref:hypothetical protein n=1 Tax=Micromonospora sp. MS34 TaxID=3385971 RepID=UPI00399F58BB
MASGDPDHEGFVLWTRLAPEPLAEDGASAGCRRGSSRSTGNSPPTRTSGTWCGAADPRPPALQAPDSRKEWPFRVGWPLFP